MISPEPPSPEQIDVYKQHAKAIEPYQKRLKQMIQKHLSIKIMAKNRSSCRTSQ